MLLLQLDFANLLFSRPFATLRLILRVPQPALSDPELAKGKSNGCPLWSIFCLLGISSLAPFAVKGLAFQFSLFGNFGDFGNLVLCVPLW
jgi:hypothetical protein